MLFMNLRKLVKSTIKRAILPIKAFLTSDLIFKLDVIEHLMRDIQSKSNDEISHQRKNTEFNGDKRLLIACDIGNIEDLLSKNTGFQHPVGVVISSQAKIGHNCKIWQNVTIGPKSIEEGLQGKYPTIGNNVQIFAGAVIIGNIEIGDNAIIGANAVVLKDVKPNTIVAGIPAKKIGTTLSKELALLTKKEDSKAFNEKIDVFKHSPVVSSLTKDSICIDCGANVGEMTAIFAQRGAQVYAFEPHPICFKKLQERFSQHSNVILFNQGVMDKNSTGRLYHSDFSNFDPEFFSQSSSVYRTKKNVSDDLYDEVDLVDLVGFINKIDKPVDILKLDVEGAEFCILERIIQEHLYDKIKFILVETHDDRIPEIRQCAERVRAAIKQLKISNIDLSWC